MYMFPNIESISARNLQFGIFIFAEFIAPDALFKTTNAGASIKRRGYPDMCASGG